MNKLIAMSVVTSGSYAALSSTSLVASGTLVAARTNGDPPVVPTYACLVRGHDGSSDVYLPIETPIRLDRVDLSTVLVKTAGGGAGALTVSFIGNTG